MTSPLLSSDLITCSHCNGTGKVKRPPLTSVQLETAKNRLEFPSESLKPDELEDQQLPLTGISLDSESNADDENGLESLNNEESSDLDNETPLSVENQVKSPAKKSSGKLLTRFTCKKKLR